MTDVRKALEAARSDACRWMQCSDECLKLPDCKKASYAAILAFLRAMPEYYDLGGLRVQWEIPDLAAAVEKETQL